VAGSPDDVLGHWSTLIEGLQEPPADFYGNVETAIAKRNIPDAKTEYVEYREGGAFSGFRKYLRVRRHREVFDVCAAPFGNGCFFSWWMTEVRPELPAAASVLIVLGYLAVLGLFARWFGVFAGPIILIFLIPLVLFFASKMGTPQADDFIGMLPIFGQLYVRLFKPITYYRIDTSEMFQASVRAAVMEAVDLATTAKGVRALTELERKPTMRDFFRK
jgi:hypothetical protein